MRWSMSPAGRARSARAEIEDFELPEWQHVIDLEPDQRVPCRPRSRADDAQAAPRQDRRIFLGYLKGREGTAHHRDGAATLCDCEGRTARLHVAARQGPDRVRHHGECVNARPDPRRTRHAHPRQVRQSRSGAGSNDCSAGTRAAVRAPATRSLPPSTICSRKLRDSPPASLCRSTAPISSPIRATDKMPVTFERDLA